MGRPPRVVIVDDSPEVLSVIGDVLRQAGPYQVSQVPGDSTRLSDITQASPDLLIVDLRLGGRDEGWRLVQAMRADPHLAEVPVVLCSADIQQLRERAEEIAATPDVVTLEKPFSIDELEVLLRATIFPRASRKAVAAAGAKRD